MSDILNTIKEMYRLYTGFGWGMHIFLNMLCLFYLAFSNREEKKSTDKFFIWFSLLWAIIYACPLSAHIIMKYCEGAEVYWRMFWVLPTTITIAYTGTVIVFDISKKQKAKRILAIISIIGIIAFSGYPMHHVYNTDKQTESGVPAELERLCDLMMYDARTRGISDVKVISGDEYVPYIRQYDGSILQPYGRNVLRDLSSHRIHEILSDKPISCKKLVKQARKHNCNYLIYKIGDDYTTKNNLIACGYEIVAEVDGATLFYLNQ